MLSREQFAEKMLSALTSTSPAFVLKERLDFGVTLRATDGREQSVFFNRAYEKYLRRPEELELIAVEVAAPLVCPPPTDTFNFHSVKAFILPLLKPASYGEAVRKQLDQARAPEAAMPALQTIGKSVAIAYAIEQSKSPERVMVTGADLSNWGMSREQVHEQAVSNLGMMARIRIQKGTTKEIGTFAVVEPHDSYSAARTLLKSILVALLDSLGGEVVIAIPSQDVFMAVGISNQIGIGWMRTKLMSQKFRGSLAPITDRLFVVRGNAEFGEELP